MFGFSPLSASPITSTAGGAKSKDLLYAISLGQSGVISPALVRNIKFPLAITESKSISNAVSRNRKGVVSVVETSALNYSVKRARNVVASVSQTSTITIALSRLKKIALVLAEAMSYTLNAKRTRAMQSNFVELDQNKRRLLSVCYIQQGRSRVCMRRQADDYSRGSTILNSQRRT